MLFNSLHFILFFIIITFVYFSIPHKYRWVLLLAASYYFYMCWKIEYILLIIISTLIDYVAGLVIGTAKSSRTKKIFLCMSLLTNLGLLFAFKYFNFFNDSARMLFNKFNIFYNVPYFRVLLPVGISFYTFQTLSYTIDVYRGIKEPEKHPGLFALYVAFFPQLVAGPIERATRLLPQFTRKAEFSYQRAADGLKIMAWGFFKKVVIADRLAVFVNEVYNAPAGFGGISYMVATVFFGFQIFCDFSGYSDIAIGSAKILGFDLMQNFNRPYFSKSISEFWKRWHISLSTWFRDYLYISLGGNRVRTTARRYFNVFAVFLISGLWHGANWTFIIWGALHGFYMIFSMMTRGIRERMAGIVKLNAHPALRRIIQMSITLVLVFFSWIFFRANSLKDAFHIVTRMLPGFPETTGSPFSYAFINKLLLGQPPAEFIISVLAIIFMEAVHLFQRKQSVIEALKRQSFLLRWAVYYLFIMGILFLGVFENQKFIYFQF